MEVKVEGFVNDRVLRIALLGVCLAFLLLLLVLSTVALAAFAGVSFPVTEDISKDTPFCR